MAQGMRNQRTTEIEAPHCQPFAWFAMWAIVLFVVPLPPHLLLLPPRAMIFLPIWPG